MTRHNNNDKYNRCSTECQHVRYGCCQRWISSFNCMLRLIHVEHTPNHKNQNNHFLCFTEKKCNINNNEAKKHFYFHFLLLLWWWWLTRREALLAFTNLLYKISSINCPCLLRSRTRLLTFITMVVYLMNVFFRSFLFRESSNLAISEAWNCHCAAWCINMHSCKWPDCVCCTEKARETFSKSPPTSLITGKLSIEH